MGVFKDFLILGNYVIHLMVFFLWIIPSVSVSIKIKCLNDWRCNRFIKTTIFGYTIDTADGQWRDLRDKMWLLWVAMFAVTISHFAFKIMTLGTKFGNKKKINNKDIINQTSTRSSSLSIDNNNNSIDDIVIKNELEEDIPPSSYFRLIVGIAFIMLLHGRHSLVVLIISYLGFKLAKSQTNSKNSTLYTWIYAISILLFKESYRLQHRPEFHFLRPIFDRTFGGLYGWQLPANFLILRIISFSFDYYWSCSYHKDKSSINNNENQSIHITSTNTNDENKKSNLRNRNKSSTSQDSNETIILNTNKEETQPIRNKHRQLNEYNFINFIAYILYPPLYMAGPIMSFNDFVENTKNPQKSEDPWLYGLRWLLCFGLMDFMSNQFPFFAIINSGLVSTLNAQELVVLAYITLKMMWLKFLLIWRFFRLWAMADGTLAPENMLRCMSNNSSLEKFWRGWHSSFNKWIIRYMYKPLGGRDRRMWSVWPIFLFVAVWHDIELKLLIWGGLNSFFFILEIAAKRLAETEFMINLPSSIFHSICVLSGASYIIVLVGVNMLGYAVGVGGIQIVLQKLCTWEGLKILFISYYFLVQAVSFLDYLSKKGLAKK